MLQKGVCLGDLFELCFPLYFPPPSTIIFPEHCGLCSDALVGFLMAEGGGHAG